MKELVEAIARALVDHPEDVQVKSVEGSQVTVLELRVHPEDLGKVIGRQGRTAKAMRSLLGASGVTAWRSVALITRTPRPFICSKKFRLFTARMNITISSGFTSVPVAIMSTVTTMRGW